MLWSNRKRNLKKNHPPPLPLVKQKFLSVVLYLVIKHIHDKGVVVSWESICLQTNIHSKNCLINEYDLKLKITLISKVNMCLISFYAHIGAKIYFC